MQIKLGSSNPGVDAELRRTLEAISISRIFDIEGLWEVLRELGEAEVETGSHHDHKTSEEIPSRRVPDADQEEESLPVPVREGEGATRSPAREKKEVRAKTALEKTGTEYQDLIPSGASPKPTASLPRRITELPPLRIRSELQPLLRKSEILDSEDEEPLSSSPLSSPPPSTVARESTSPPQEYPQSPADTDSKPTLSPTPAAPEESPGELKAAPSSPPPEDPRKPASIPSMILITHFSSLLTTLFTHTDKTTAHTRLQLLASYLHDLARSAAADDPLIMILNSTTSPSPDASTSKSTSTSTSTSTVPGPPQDPRDARHQRPLDPTLRSIFNPAPRLRGVGYDHGYGHGYPYGAAGAATTTRRNKPSFGATFAQFLDLHLLCTPVPRTRDDAEVAVALGAGASAEDVRYVWVVEVLLDEVGFWEWGVVKGKEGEREQGKKKGKGKGGEERGKDDDDDDAENVVLPTRVNREQRWAALDVRDHVRVVDAFAAGGGGAASGSASLGVRRGPVRVAAGFGGPRV